MHLNTLKKILKDSRICLGAGSGVQISIAWSSLKISFLF